jgi:hypothetical protein
MTEKEWYELQELADEWNVPVTRVRITVANLEPIGAIQTRDRPGDRRFKQVHRDSLETLRKALGV